MRQLFIWIDSPSKFDSDTDFTPNKGNVNEIIPILAELNEASVEYIAQEQYDESLDSLLKAEYIISVLLPQGGDAAVLNNPIEETYICTIYYNLAWVCQKLNKLQECVKYMKKWIDTFNIYCNLGTRFEHSEHGSKLIITKFSDLPKAAQYNDLLMKYRYLTKFNLQLWAILSQLSLWVLPFTF